MARIQTLVPVPPPFSLEQVVFAHGWWEVRPFQWLADEGRLVRVDRISGHLRVASVVQAEPEQLVVEHEPDDVSAVDRMRTVLSLDVLGVDEFQRSCDGHPTLAWVHEAGAGRFLRGIDAWEDASKAVCFTNLKWAQAVRCLNALSEAGPKHQGLHCWPTPDELLERGESWLRAHGRIGYRARFLHALAEQFRDGVHRRDQVARSDFQAMPGIGPATAAYLAGMWGDWTVLSFDSSIRALLRDRDGLVAPTREDAEVRYGYFGDFQGLACLLDASGWRRGFS